MPRLGDVIGASIEGVERPAKGYPKDGLVRNTIRVRGGTLRVRNVVMWDHGAFPLTGDDNDRGRYTASHVPLKFVGSRWQGHMASEFIVEHWGVNSVDVTASAQLRRRGFFDVALEQELPKNKLPSNTHAATRTMNHRVPYNTVEILITNYEFQDHKAVPWGLDFQWLFEREGYAPVDLSRDLGLFDQLGTAFDPEIYNNDRKLLLNPPVGKEQSEDLNEYVMGLPFPYVPPNVALETLEKLGNDNDTATPRAPIRSADEEDRPICIGGFK